MAQLGIILLSVLIYGAMIFLLLFLYIPRQADLYANENIGIVREAEGAIKKNESMVNDYKKEIENNKDSVETLKNYLSQLQNGGLLEIFSEPVFNAKNGGFYDE